MSSMRIACVSFPHLYMQIEKLGRSELDGCPAIIGGRPEERGCVADCSEEAASQGVFAGMSLRQAYQLCPEAVFLPFSDRYARLWEEILFALGAFALRIESTAPGLAYLDITEAVKRYGNERAMAHAIIREMRGSLRVEAKAGVGNSRFLASQAALSAWDALVIKSGEEKEFLALLSVETLPLSNEEKERLRLLGLGRLKKIAALSRKALLSQFGPTGNVLFDIVNGADEKRRIAKRQGALCFEREFGGEAPLETLGELQAVVESMVGGLSDELRRMRLACRKAALALFFRDGSSLEKTLVMKKPTAEARLIAGRLCSFLEHIEAASPVTSFRLSIPEPVAARGDQEDLFRKRSASTERLQAVRAYFEARDGQCPVMRIEENEEKVRLPERRFRFTNV